MWKKCLLLIVVINYTKSNAEYLMNKIYRKWQPEDIEFIEKNYIQMTDQNIAITLSKITGYNITVDMIRRQRRKLNLSRPKGRPAKK